MQKIGFNIEIMNILNLNPCKIEGITPHGEEKIFTVNDFLGKTAVIYFYPNDGTPGCTIQAGDFRDNMKYFEPLAVVAGVNRDSISSHKKFMENEDLNFILLSDPDKKLINFFGVWGEKPAYGIGFMGIIRSTFIINPKGEIVKSWFNVNVEGHVEEVLNELETFMG